jgi:transcriptional regulator with PAS, ATPase and Fis domain/CHASE2 domain-containing sensor protein
MTALIIGITSALVVGVLVALIPNIVSSWEWNTYDLRMQWRGAIPPTDHLVIIGRDDKSDEQFGVGIWDRDIFAKMIAALQRAGARTIALDFHFSGASPQQRGGKASDQMLIDATASAGMVLFPLPVTLDPDTGDTPIDSSHLTKSLVNKGLPTDPTLLQQIPHASRVFPPLPDLMNAAQGLGHIGAISDPDGIYRRVPAFVNGGDVAVPAMGVALAAAYLKVKPDAMRFVPSEALELKGATFPDGTKRDLSVPIDAQGNVFIDYVGRWEDGPFPYFSFVEVLNTIKEEGGEGELRKYVAGKAVLILHAAVEADKRRTPLELTAPGGFILANTFNTIVTEGRLRPLRNIWQWGLVMLLAIAAAWAVLMFPLWGGLVSAGGLGISYLACAYWGFASFSVVLPMGLPIAGLVLATGGALAWTSWWRLGQIKEFEGQIQESESNRLALQQELAGLQNHLMKQETHVKRLEDDLAKAQTEYLALQHEIKDHQKLLGEQDAHVKQLEGELANTQIEANKGNVQAIQLRESKEVELRLVKEDLAQTKHIVMKLQVGFVQLTQVHESRDAELRQGKEDLAQTRHTIAELQAQRASTRIRELDHGVLSCKDKQTLMDECAEHRIITCDSVMLSLWKNFQIEARDQYLPILILGESGTGKELFAKAAHKLSGRKEDGFVAVNMATLQPETSESRLFGHEKGAFTGAVGAHDGHFLQADKGTIFLDEIDKLQLDLQAKLLRVLQEGEVWRMGATKSKQVDVRVVAATNRNLLQAIADGRFLEDLYYRINTVELRLPPLRERPGDIPLLAEHFVKLAAAKRGRSNIEISQGAIDRLKSWPWKGNIRELQHCLERAVVLAKGSKEITERHLRLSEASVSTPTSASPQPVVPVKKDGLDLEPDDLALLRILRKHALSIEATATELGRDRSTVTNRLKGLCFEALVRHQGDERAAATSLAGEPGLTTLVLAKLNEYVEPLRKVVDMSSSHEAARAECKRLFKNMPKRYFSSVEALIQKFWHDRSLIQSGPSGH